ncbi:MAG TPA: hypothetical protein VH476_10285 [Solirubrobacterales bacterium]
MGDEARPFRRQRQRELERIGPGDAGRDAPAADGPTRRVEEGDSDPYVAAAPAAEAELPRAAAMEGPQREAEESSRGAPGGQPVEPRERNG